MAARAGVEPTTLRLKAIDSTKAPPCPSRRLIIIDHFVAPKEARSMYINLHQRTISCVFMIHVHRGDEHVSLLSPWANSPLVSNASHVLVFFRSSFLFLCHWI